MEKNSTLREIKVSESVFIEIQDALKEEGKTTTAQLQQQQEPGNCTLQIVFGPDGSLQGWNCIGRCGLFDRFLGRSCQKGTRGTPDGGVSVACTCRGGWFDSIFRRTS